MLTPEDAIIRVMDGVQTLTTAWLELHTNRSRNPSVGPGVESTRVFAASISFR